LVVVTHEDRVSRVATRVMRLKEGKLLEETGAKGVGT
jgi:ABC-type lipoprotein export system ATPase subunit